MPLPFIVYIGPNVFIFNVIQCRSCNVFEWVSPAERVAAACLREPKSLSESHLVHTTNVRTSNHSNEHNFDLDDRIISESELDMETRALLYSLWPDDFPASYSPMLEDSHLAMLIHQAPENNESFLALLRDAGPSPVKSAAHSVDYDNCQWDTGSFGDFRESTSSFNTAFPTDFDGMADFFQGVNTADGPTSTLGHDLDLHSSDFSSSAAISQDEVADHPLDDVHASQSNPTTIPQPLVATKNPGAPRKCNSKGKLECTARGCTKFVLAAKCKSQMCKGHCVTNGGCQDHGGGKGNNGDSDSYLENSAPISMASTDNNHWALSRPPSAIPLQPISTSATNNAVSVNQTNNKVTTGNPEKMFRTEMSPTHEAAWRQKKQAQLEALESKSLKAEYERRYQNQIVVIFWDKVGSPINIIGSTQILILSYNDTYLGWRRSNYIP
jgi:hypothetical protein